MVNRPKRLGTEFETAVKKYLEERGIRIKRRALVGGKDEGDFYLPDHEDWVLEAKNHASIDLAGFMDEAKLEQVNADADKCAVIIKRRKKGTARAYVVMELEQFAEICLGAEHG